MLSGSGLSLFFFFFNDTATTEIYTLSLHDALPIFCRCGGTRASGSPRHFWRSGSAFALAANAKRSEEHTSELQSQSNLVCRLLLEKKKNNYLATTAHSLHANLPPCSIYRSCLHTTV